MHLNFFETGAPGPSTCMKCGDYRNLFDLGVDVWDGAALLCKNCIKGMAELVGYVDGDAANDVINQLTESLHVSRETVAKIPNEVETLIDGIRSSVADFVLAISGGGNDSSSVPVQGDGDSAEAVANDVKPAAGNRKAPSKSASN